MIRNLFEIVFYILMWSYSATFECGISYCMVYCDDILTWCHEAFGITIPIKKMKGVVYPER